MKTEVVVMEHPDFGEARVLCRWEKNAAVNSFQFVPFAVEFDLFTPLEEQEALTRELRVARLTGILA